MRTFGKKVSKSGLRGSEKPLQERKRMISIKPFSGDLQAQKAHLMRHPPTKSSHQRVKMCRSRKKRPFGNSLDVSEPKLGPLDEVLSRQRLSVVDDAVRG